MPHGLEFNQRGGAGDFRRDRFYDMLEHMQASHDAATKRDPETAAAMVEEVVREERVSYDFSNGQEELNLAGAQKFPLDVDVDKVTTRPVFTIRFNNDGLEEKDWRVSFIQDEGRGWPIRITAPNGASFDYVIDLQQARSGVTTISGVGFMGAETQGTWTIESKDPERVLPVTSIDLDLFTVNKDDLITKPEFRKLHTIASLTANDQLTHLRDIWLQDGGVDGAGGWLSKAVEEGWEDKLDLTGTILEPDLMATLPRSERLPTGYVSSGDYEFSVSETSPPPIPRPAAHQSTLVISAKP